jgi:neutral ceramidase
MRVIPIGMTVRKRVACCCWLDVLLVLTLTATGARAAELRLGAAAVPINPPLGIGLAGYYHERGSEGVLDDIFAKAIVLDDGKTRAAIVVCDLISMPRWIVLEARQIIESQTGIPGTNVLIAATHTHTAPVLFREWSRDDTDGGATPVSKNYSRTLPKLITEAVASANGKRQPVHVAVAKENEGRMANNRRFWMRDGSVGWNPGKLNSQIVRPAGPIDPEVGILYGETAAENPAPILTFVNYAMHPDTTGGKRISADYPGALSRALALYKGPEMLTLFGNGTCGNINHIDVHWAGAQSSPQEATRLGAILAAAVFKAYPRLQPLSSAAPLQVRSEIVKLPLPHFTREQLEQARLDVRAAKDNTRDGFVKLVRAHRVLDVASREGKPQEVEMQVITLGHDVAWVAWPGEIFVELGLSVKAGSPFAHTYNVELANGAIGYIPNKPAYSEGNYEVESARVAEGSGEMLVTSALGMLAELHRAATAASRTGGQKHRAPPSLEKP